MVKISGGYGKLKTWVTSVLTTHTAIASAHHTNHQTASSETASFKEVNIAVNEAYKQGADIILRIKTLNIFVGIDAGKVTTGNYNSFMGYAAGYSNTSGYRNSFMGYKAGYSNIDGHYNSFMGYAAGCSNTSGCRNSFMGYKAGYSNIDGHDNSSMGNYAGYSNTSGCGNFFMGYKAGYYETGSHKLFIDTQTRTNEADGRLKALIYGVFNAATANQLLRINGVFELTEIKNGSTQVNAGAAANEVWKTNGHATLPDNVLIIGV